MIGIKKETVQLWGREFDIERQGLSQPQIVAFVTELIDENKALNEKVKHLAFLEKLAEQTVTEADKMAVAIKNKAQEEAASILQASKEEAAEIKANAREELKQLLTGSRERLESELRRRVDEVYRRIFGQVEGILAKVWPPEMSLEVNEAPHQQPIPVPEPDEKTKATATEEASPVLYEEEIEEVEEVNEAPHQQPISVPEPNVETKGTAIEEASPVPYAGKVDLDVLPPVDLAQLMKLRKELRQIPQFKILQITSSQKKGSRISILLTEPVPLVNVLETIPEVHEAIAEMPVETTTAPEEPQTERIERIAIRLAAVGQT